MILFRPIRCSVNLTSRISPWDVEPQLKSKNTISCGLARIRLNPIKRRAKSTLRCRRKWLVGDFGNGQQRISQASRRQGLHVFSTIYECAAVDFECSVRVNALPQFQSTQPRTSCWAREAEADNSGLYCFPNWIAHVVLSLS